MSKGFTFAQLATLILVIMGLTIVVVIAATQLVGSGQDLRDISDAGNVQGAVDALTGISCRSAGGECSVAACTTSAVEPNDCKDTDGTDINCCATA